MRVAYIDSSVLVRYYLPLDPHHDEAIALIDDDDTAIVTSPWTRIEASGALVRASRSQRVSPDAALARLDEDTSVGPITLISVPQAEAESIALSVVRVTGIRALDAWHIAVAVIALPSLVGPGDEARFMTRDSDQAAAAIAFGLAVV